MAERNLLILEKKESPWFGFLEEFFEDTPSMLHVFHHSTTAGQCLDRIPPDMIFVNPEMLSLSLAQKINVLQQSRSHFRVFQLGSCEGVVPKIQWDACFREIPLFVDFRKTLVEYLPLPEKISVLVVDDEPEIGTMLRDFLERRVNPAFLVDYASDGVQGLQAIEKNRPDVLVLDIKMPVQDGREVYREITKRNLKIPVIVFFDAISGDEILEIHQIGKPAIVEKGSRESSMPELMSLIKKMAYFG
jgi:CheY-like chemotaxis protein